MSSSSSSLTSSLGPAAALLSLYLGLLLAAAVLAAVEPLLRRTRALLAVYCAVRSFSLAVWVSAASGAVAPAGLLQAAYSFWFAGWFMLLTAALPLFVRWLAALAVASYARTRALSARLAVARVLALLAVVAMLVGGSQLLSTSAAWAAPLSYAGAAVFLAVVGLLLPLVLADGVRALRAARASMPAGLKLSAERELVGRAMRAAAALAFILLCVAVRAALAIVTIASPSFDAGWQLGIVVGPELPAAIAMLLVPVGGFFMYDDLVGRDGRQLVAETLAERRGVLAANPSVHSFRVASPQPGGQVAADMNAYV